MNTTFTYEDDKYIINNYKKMTCKQIGNFLGFNDKQVQRRATYLGVTSKHRKYNLNFF